MRPGRHVLLVGEPRAGRSDLVEALRRVLDSDSTRTPPAEFDVHLPIPSGDRGPGPETGIGASEIEIVLADLGEVLEQHFYRRLELWDAEDDELVEASTAAELDEDRHELVLRLCYRLRWDHDEGTGEHWVDYPKNSDPDEETLRPGPARGPRQGAIRLRRAGSAADAALRQHIPRAVELGWR
ncbi:hypothetical protein ACFQ68_16720 [Amycolatopsis japonica]|uniref:hypothetical protein n=1 Tax=Amycolatopsis japonica TaxID=208439 RepID=UPI0036712CD7